MTIRPITAELVHTMREASGIGMMDCKAAAELALKDLHCDFVLALRMRHYHALAVNIGSRDPAVSPARARRQWDAANALGDRDDLVAKHDAWRRLDAMSNKWDGNVRDL